MLTVYSASKVWYTTKFATVFSFSKLLLIKYLFLIFSL